MATPPGTMEKFYNMEQWLEFEKTAEARHEFYYGKLITLDGGSKKANRIINNFVILLDGSLYERKFHIFTHDIKAEVVPNGVYRYPDLVVAPIVDDEHDYIVKHPVLMAEVASDQSGQRDRIKKRKEYLAIPSLWYYLVADQDEMLVELHIRGEDGRWETQYFTEPDDLIRLSRFELEFPLKTIYERLKMPL